MGNLFCGKKQEGGEDTLTEHDFNNSSIQYMQSGGNNDLRQLNQNILNILNSEMMTGGDEKSYAISQNINTKILNILNSVNDMEGGGDGESDNKNIEIRSNNSFLHDNVD